MRLYIVSAVGPAGTHKAFLDAVSQLRVIGYEVEARSASVHIPQCQGVATVTGWEGSEGAKGQVRRAKALGLPVRSVSEWIFDADMENRSVTVEASDG